MKKGICLILASMILISVFCITAYADAWDQIVPVFSSRAGGGGSSGGGGGGGGGSGGSSSSHSSYTGRRPTLLESIINYIMLPFVLLSSTIVSYIRLTRRSKKAKMLMKQMRKSDEAWKYKNLFSNVKESFFAIQNAWTNMDMSPASSYMSEDLLNNFQTKLNWMSYKNQKNVLEQIQLIKALPVAVHDDPDNSRDYAWFYIKGKMVDYTIDTHTNLVVDGNTRCASFVEYWQFVRKDHRWVLNKILQKNEENQIPFTE